MIKPPDEFINILFSPNVELFITSSMSILFIAFVIKNANKHINYLEEIDILGTVLGLAKILLVGILIILIRDTIPKIVRNIAKKKSILLCEKHNKAQEEGQG